MDPWSIGLQALGILKGGAGSAPPSVTATSGGPTFDNQTINFGDMGIEHALPDWLASQGGNGPPAAQAFTAPRTDSFVMGLTGLSTTGRGTAVGNGIGASQPAAISNSLLHNPMMWAALAAVGIAILWMHKK